MSANMANFIAAGARERALSKTGWRSERNWELTFSRSISIFLAALCTAQHHPRALSLRTLQTAGYSSPIATALLRRCEKIPAGASIETDLTRRQVRES